MCVLAFSLRRRSTTATFPHTRSTCLACPHPSTCYWSFPDTYRPAALDIVKFLSTQFSRGLVEGNCGHGALTRELNAACMSPPITTMFLPPYIRVLAASLYLTRSFYSLYPSPSPSPALLFWRESPVRRVSHPFPFRSFPFNFVPSLSSSTYYIHPITPSFGFSPLIPTNISPLLYQCSSNASRRQARRCVGLASGYTGS
ncbi:hypothetical protein MVEN_00480900 [Mycena venus]|uniref:Uncharacterized protein n=1 Tax=Mycena venus TaxID=2733690 RepID=A0A8H6YVM0_9AGAR|nr:hypothetical protein MVEN_00480900 [Mycena venus]